jgi:hypothetical protein
MHVGKTYKLSIDWRFVAVLAVVNAAIAVLMLRFAATNESTWIYGGIEMRPGLLNGAARGIGWFLATLSVLLAVKTAATLVSPSEIRVTPDGLDLPGLPGRRTLIPFRSIQDVGETSAFGRAFFTIHFGDGRRYNVEEKALAPGDYQELLAYVREKARPTSKG